MIHVTQGHENGIGLEVFFKSLRLLSQKNVDQLRLYVQPESAKETLKTITSSYSLENDVIDFEGKLIKTDFIEQSSFESTKSLEMALAHIAKDDVLFTLPTSKDQLHFANKKQLGYTEYLRNFYKNKYLTMVFKSKSHVSALLSDHIPLKDVSETLSDDYVYNKAKLILNQIGSYLGSLDQVFFSGINPHAGEKGSLGHEDSVILKTINRIKRDFPHLAVHKEPVPADALHFHFDNSKKQIFIYAYHDQALTLFKQRFGLFAANVTLGLPFKRLSVDHGTAFSLYGKNLADSSGCLYCLSEALTWNNNEHK